MKKEWGQWKTLLHGESGLGWNHIKGTVDATPEWWQKKIHVNPSVAKFREKGPLCQYEQDMLFSDVIANGTSSWTPSSGVMPQHMQEEMEEESHCEPSEDFESVTQSEPQIPTDAPNELPIEAPTSSKRKSTEFLNRLRKRKAKKVTNGDKISTCLERMVEAMEHESTRNIVDTGRQYSIQNCLEILENMPEIEEGDPLWIMGDIDDDSNMDSLSQSSSSCSLDALSSGDEIESAPTPTSKRTNVQDCIGAIDGTHIKAALRKELQTPFIGRKGTPTQNIMAVCDFDMCFTYVLPGKYYLVDAGYPNIPGFLAPYKYQKYHLPDFQRATTYTNQYEVFNHFHSSIRSTIERAFGCWKERFYTMKDIPINISWEDQVALVPATMAIHNFIRKVDALDEDFSQYDRDPEYLPNRTSNRRSNDNIHGPNFDVIDGGMDRVRDDICTSIAFSRIGIFIH
ncbi:PREDICTED: uncharacterized protein LOC105971511 [Erythranthe guttata]|uniref:uncharacterized protein LOC105971511 n=1 Tax=Erythranthe guttata TaxID=4155 RepID=UPI00064DE46A|nr:PREDICTED: uncharacterized protein LOC105971511 [Erythranthe guttata]|eukprot:XP_012851818.1 PREDICTED: uncharacterized protein LOC105971511 [Erythranthe guttata]